MKTNFLFFLFAVTLCIKSIASIYEADGRQLVYSSEDNTIQNLSQSIAAKLRTKPILIGNSKFKIPSKALGQHIKNLCPGEKFSKIETLSNCTAFLVGENLMVTAGHCINTQEECENSTWLFSSNINPTTKNPTVDKSDFVNCEKLINRVKNSISKNDWALFKTSSSSKKRPFLKFRREGKINNKATLTVIGHPTGLPLVISDKAEILKNNSDFLFKINSDTFGGNSGSPVFNESTGLVEGILTDGDLDYKLNKARGCKETYKCPVNGCKGENVVRITNIPELVPGMTPEEPIFDPKRPQL